MTKTKKVLRKFAVKINTDEAANLQTQWTLPITPHHLWFTESSNDGDVFTCASQSLTLHPVLPSPTWSSLTFWLSSLQNGKFHYFWAVTWWRSMTFLWFVFFSIFESVFSNTIIK